MVRGGLSIGLRGAIAQGHHKIGGTTLADCRMDILVAYIIFLKGTYDFGPVILINRGHEVIGPPTHWWHVEKPRTQALLPF